MLDFPQPTSALLRGPLHQRPRNGAHHESSDGSYLPRPARQHRPQDWFLARGTRCALLCFQGCWGPDHPRIAQGRPPAARSQEHEPNFQTDITRRFEKDADANSQLDRTVRLDSLKQEDYDSVFYPGGHGPMWDLAEDKNSIKLLESFLAAGKTFAAVCHSTGALARHAAADDLAFEHAERGEQGRRAVAFVIVREGCAFPPLQRKTRLGPVKRLDLAFLVDGDHHRMAWRVHVKTDDIIKLGGEVGIVGSLEGPDPVRLELMGSPYALDRSQRKTHRLGHGAAGPMGDCSGRFAQGALDHGMHLGLWHWRDAGRAGLVAQQTLNAFLGEALLPAHHRPADADPLGNLQHRQA